MVFEIHQAFEREFTVTEEIYQGFIRIFRDENPLHTDERFARARGFRGPVMHGNILNGFLSYFVGEVLPSKELIIHSQEISYKHPVYLNDTLRLKAVVSEIHESVNAVVFKFQFYDPAGNTAARGKIQIGILS
jgi:3-hydroxybutyryl-CoA dehydratase